MDINIDMNDINDMSNLPTFDITRRKQLIKEISKLKKVEHIEIFKIFKKDNIKYTENNNGIFINISKIPDITLRKVKKFLLFYNKNNKQLNDYTTKRQQLEIDYFSNKDKFI